VVNAASIQEILPTLRDIETITSRATAPLTQLIDWSFPLLQRGATGVFLKGRSVQQEIDALPKAQWFDLSTLPSRTDSSGGIVSVRYRSEAIR
jgi:16S rRNA (guanine527-N7)-methyltransferase